MFPRRAKVRNGSEVDKRLLRRFLHRIANPVDQRFDHRQVVAFGHDADEGFGARLADDEAAAAFELALGIGDRGLDRGSFERLATGEADVLQKLRDRFEQMEQLARRLAVIDQRGQHLQPRDQPVAGGRMI